MKLTAFLDKYGMVIIVVLLVFSGVFIIVGHKYRDQVQLVLKKNFANLPDDNIDGWSISHLVLYAIIGFIKPNYHLTAFTIGAVFEVFEDYMAADKNTQLVNCSEPFKENGTRKFFCNGRQDDYWYAKHSDIFWNLLGYTIGSAIRTTFLKDSFNL
jgi:hypothetical protein